MHTPVRRTGTTDFSDPELLILDMIALGGGVRSMYFQDIFPLQFNCPSHNLNDDDLTRTLDRFESQGIITGTPLTVRSNEPDRTVDITKWGGSLWESERNPDWTRYVTESYGGYQTKAPNSRRHRVTILGHSPAICKAFFDVGCESRFFDYRNGKISRGVGHRELTLWRPAQTVYMISAWIESWQTPMNWDLFESRRCWWRFAHEIGNLWGWPPATVSPISA